MAFRGSVALVNTLGFLVFAIAPHWPDGAGAHTGASALGLISAAHQAGWGAGSS